MRGKRTQLLFVAVLNRPLFWPEEVQSDFEIKDFYLTSESDVTYFIHFNPIMCIFYFLNPVSEAQRSQGWSEQEKSAVLYFVLALKHWQPLLPLIIIREAWRWPRKQASSSRWKDCRALHPYNLWKCKMYFVCVSCGGGT